MPNDRSVHQADEGVNQANSCALTSALSSKPKWLVP